MDEGDSAPGLDGGRLLVCGFNNVEDMIQASKLSATLSRHRNLPSTISEISFEFLKGACFPDSVELRSNCILQALDVGAEAPGRLQNYREDVE